ncbi:ABC transporter ATP-binding protein [Candidatus Endolissoclinum faulkneri]|nr:ABC transporter ATP-binding protein [Candidatus Endolissoclinum faulkneri]
MEGAFTNANLMSFSLALISNPASISLDAKNISLYDGDKILLEVVTLSVGTGEVVGLLGPNGSGKSTLLKILACISEPSEGEVILNGKPIIGLDRKSIAQMIGYLPQGANSEWPISAREVVMLGRIPFLSSLSKISAADHIAVNKAMLATDTAHLTKRAVTTLSCGERMRVMLARALTGDQSLLLLDEPVTGLDPRHQLEAMILLNQLAMTGRSSLVVLHDITLAARFCRRIYVLHQGMIVSEGPPSEALDIGIMASVFGIEARFIEEDKDVLIIPWSLQKS